MKYLKTYVHYFYNFKQKQIDILLYILTTLRLKRKEKIQKICLMFQQFFKILKIFIKLF